MGVARGFLGIHLSPAAVQYEGLDAVMDRIQGAGATAIGTGLTVFEPSNPGEGRRQPPLDVDGTARLLDRPLWGRRELWLKGYRARPYEVSLFSETTYRPDRGVGKGGDLAPGGGLAPPHIDRELPHKIISAAQQRGMRAYVSLSPLCVPGLRDRDQPHYVDGGLPDLARRVAGQGCPNNPDIAAYAVALVRDTIRHYPDIDGIYLDWLEYTVYQIEDHFACFCPHCIERARATGYDWDRIRRDISTTWEWLHHLTPTDIDRMSRAARSPGEMIAWVRDYPGWLDLLRFKADSVCALYGKIRAAMDNDGAAAMELGANGWAPPFNLSSGADYRRLADIVTAVRPKLHTFHWSTLPRWYGERLRAWNPTVGEQPILDMLVTLLDLPDDQAPRSFDKYHIPAPDEIHPARPEAWRTKLQQAVDQVGGRAKCYAYAHSYRPLKQWRQMIEVVRETDVDGMWVQRYGYLSDAKLRVLGDLWP